jgi:hypothetical protein
VNIKPTKHDTTMITSDNNKPKAEEVHAEENDTATYGDDTIGENTGDSALEIDAEKNGSAAKPVKQTETPDPRVDTVVPDNDN